MVALTQCIGGYTQPLPAIDCARVQLCRTMWIYDRQSGLRSFHHRATCLDLVLLFQFAFAVSIGISKGAGWSSLVARQAHNLKAAGSNPAPATNFPFLDVGSLSRLCAAKRCRQILYRL